MWQGPTNISLENVKRACQYRDQSPSVIRKHLIKAFLINAYTQIVPVLHFYDNKEFLESREVIPKDLVSIQRLELANVQLRYTKKIEMKKKTAIEQIIAATFGFGEKKLVVEFPYRRIVSGKDLYAPIKSDLQINENLEQTMSLLFARYLGDGRLFTPASHFLVPLQQRTGGNV